MPVRLTFADARAAPSGLRLSRFLPNPRRITYPVLGTVLAAGAPLGLALLRAALTGDLSGAAIAQEVRQDLPTFLYVTISTALVFSAFGGILGWHADMLVHLSRTDPLTGLRNQRAFEERLAEEIARAERYGAPLSLLLADVDGLKTINDRGGHHAGNGALRAVADALAQGARQTDLPARVGGDEFALIAPNTVLPEATALAERIRSLLAARADSVTLSIGVAALGYEWSDAPSLLEAADAALYQAKRNGRDRVVAAASGESLSPDRKLS
jgi:diguanylate cyclase (GGDEF)-like protein